MAKPLSVLYFTRDKTAVAKEVAAAIRIEGNECNLAFAGGFRDDSQAMNCDAVVIQDSCGRKDQIIEAYNRIYPNTEIHLYDDEGAFIPPSETTTDEATTEQTEDPVVQDETVAGSDEAGDAADNEVVDEGVQNDASDGVVQQPSV